MHTVSIRMSVIELIEDFLFQQAAFERSKLQEILKEFFFAKFPEQILSSTQKLNFIQQARSVAGLDRTCVAIPAAVNGDHIEIALYMMGQLNEELSVPIETA
jgi:hypothetical protein